MDLFGDNITFLQDSTLPILEVSLSCSELTLQKAIESKKLLHIRGKTNIPKVLLCLLLDWLPVEYKC